MEWDEKPPFISNLKFYGDDYFPYGLGRCGEFTLSQVALLEVHGRAYEGLHLGTREPSCDEEREFIAVCRGERAPETEHERVWMLFQEKVNSSKPVSAFESTSSGSATRERFHVEDLSV